MGSGLILLVIVAAWLAVLVPMALRSSDTADSVGSVDRFSDAMRVLSRRDAAARARAREVAGASRLGEDPDDAALSELAELDDADDGDLDDLDLSAWDPERDGVVARARRLAGSARAAVRSRRAARPPLTPAARRRRLLLVLLVLAAGTLAGALLAGGAVWVAHAVADLLVVLYLVALRRLVAQRAARRPAPVRRPAPRPAAPAEVAPVEEVPVASEPAPLDPPADAPAAPVEEVVAAVARHDEPVPAVPERSPGLGALWSPVPVPPPLYARAPVAPRLPRTVDLTRPGAYSEAAAAGERLPGMEDLPAAPQRVEEPRRAVNDW